MGGPHARWIVAAVQNAKAFWNGAVDDLPAKSMGHGMTFVDRQLSVTPYQFGRSPYPAVARAIYFAPESWVCIQTA